MNWGGWCVWIGILFLCFVFFWFEMILCRRWLVDVFGWWDEMFGRGWIILVRFFYWLWRFILCWFFWLLFWCWCGLLVMFGCMSMVIWFWIFMLGFFFIWSILVCICNVLDVLWIVLYFFWWSNLIDFRYYWGLDRVLLLFGFY